MSQPVLFPYVQLNNLSFIQLFQLFRTLVAWKWMRRKEKSFVLGRASDCCRERLAEPAYAAVLLMERNSTPSELITHTGAQERKRKPW